MKHTKQNSAEAHKAFEPKAGSVAARVIATLREFIYCSRRHLNAQTNIEIATLCGALAKLEKQGVVRVAFSSECETTGKMVAIYALNESEVA